MTPQLCGYPHRCQYAAENGLDPNLARLRDWCCICDDRTPCALCAPRDTPERRHDRGPRFEEAREIVQPVVEPILRQSETGIESRPLSIWRRLGPRLAWLPGDQIGVLFRTAGSAGLWPGGVGNVFR